MRRAPRKAPGKDPPHAVILNSLSSVPNFAEDNARALFGAGFRTTEQIRDAPEDDIATVPGIGKEMAHSIKEALGDRSRKTTVQGDAALADWLKGDADDKSLASWLGEKGKPAAKARPKASGAPEPAESADALKRWLMGEEDTLQSWLGEAGVKGPAAPKKAGAPAATGAELAEKEKKLAELEEILRLKEEEVRGMKVENDTLRSAMETEMKKIQSGDFDPMVLIEETARLNRELQAEVRKRKQLEEEIRQVKKGSVAVIKYVKAQQLHAKDDAARSIKKMLDEETAENERLRIEIKKLEEVNVAIKSELEGKYSALPQGDKALKERELALMEKEKSLEAMKAEMGAKEKAMKEAAEHFSGPAQAVAAGEAGELQQRLMAELASKEQEYLEREGNLKKQILDFEGQVRELQIQVKQMEDSRSLQGKGKGEIDAELAKKERELQIKEKSMLLREEEIKRLKDQLRERDDELKKVKEPMKFKDEEMLRREEDLLHREQLLVEERRRYEEAVKESGSVEAHEMKLKLEELNQEIARKEDQLRAKENYLKQRTEELRLREQGIISQEIEAREEDRAIEFQVEKVKTGTGRLDDLMLGGVPFGSSILVYGPPFTGKEVVINAFIAEGLKKGIPCIWVITDKLPSEIREEMMFIISGYEEYEKMGLVKYVDAYSKSIGEVKLEPNISYIDEPTDFPGILRAVDTVAKELCVKHKYYRLGFRSVSTLIAYLESQAAFKNLQPFIGRRKRERAVAMYSIEKGMHSDQDIQMIGSIMDGAFEFKVEQLRTYLCVKGIGNVQSRAWIEYTYSKQGLAMGSFTLEHIR